MAAVFRPWPTAGEPSGSEGRTLPTHSLRRNSRACQAKGSSRELPSRRPCTTNKHPSRLGGHARGGPGDATGGGNSNTGGRWRRQLPLPPFQQAPWWTGGPATLPPSAPNGIGVLPCGDRGSCQGTGGMSHQPWGYHGREREALLRWDGAGFAACGYHQGVPRRRLLHYAPQPATQLVGCSHGLVALPVLL